MAMATYPGAREVVCRLAVILFCAGKYSSHSWMAIWGFSPSRSPAKSGSTPYDPFRSPHRARAEELGGVLAEGIYYLLDQDRSIIEAYRAACCSRWLRACGKASPSDGLTGWRTEPGLTGSRTDKDPEWSGRSCKAATRGVPWRRRRPRPVRRSRRLSGTWSNGFAVRWWPPTASRTGGTQPLRRSVTRGSTGTPA